MKTCCFKQIRGILPALAMAAVGFSYALMTSVTGGSGLSASGSADSRAVIGTSCTRTATAFLTSTDLGTVVVGSQFTRQIIVQFGFKPHSFLFGRILPKNAIAISTSGTISGKISEAGTDVFEVAAADELGGDVVPVTTKSFTITAIAATTEPAERLNIINAAAMPNAVANEPYSFTFNVNGGLPPFSFFLVDGPNGPLPPGLALDTATGQLYGKPTIPTTTAFGFRLGLVDTTRLVVYKDFTLNVLPGTISSDLVATNGSLSLNFGKEGSTDSVKLSLVFNKFDLSNAGIRTVADLADQSFAMDFGGIQLPDRGADALGTGVVSPSKFDKNGTLRYPNLLTGGAIAKKSDPHYEVSINPKTGILKVAFYNVDLIRGLGARFASFNNPVIPISVKIGAPADAALEASNPTTTTTSSVTSRATTINFDRTDSIKFLYRRSGSKGKATAGANDRIPAGGLFLVTKVKGSALRESTLNDKILLKITGFMRLPGGTAITPGSTDTVKMLLGDKCLGDFPSSSLTTQGDLLTFGNTDERAGLKSLVIDNKKGTFTLETFAFNTGDLFDQNVLEAGVPFSVPLTLTISTPTSTTATFDGQTSVTVFRKGNSIINK